MKYPNVKFVHLREYDILGNPLPFGGCTIAFTRSPATQEGKINTYLISKAECSGRDNFCKKIGRAISMGRLEAGNYDSVNTQATQMKDIISVMVAWACSNGS